MRIIDRYITKSIVVTFFVIILIFSFLYILIDVTSNLMEILSRNVPVSVLIQYYLSFLPIILTQTAPMACLLASLLTYSYLNSNNEVIALRSGGFSFWRITRPAICFGLVVSAMIFWMNERFVPQATVSSESIRNENMILKADSEQKQGKIKNLTFYGLKNRLYFIDTFDPNTYELEGITIIGHDNKQNMVEKVVALKGKWSGILWKFSQCQTTYFESQNPNEPKDVKYSDEKLMDIKESPQDFLRQRLNVSSMNILQLQDYLKRFLDSGAKKAINDLRVDLHQKIAFPIGNVVILLFGLPLSLLTGRRKAMTFTTLGIAIGVGFLYYVANAVGLALGKGGMLLPFVSAWIAPAIFLVAALYIIKKKF